MKSDRSQHLWEKLCLEASHWQSLRVVLSGILAMCLGGGCTTRLVESLNKVPAESCDIENYHIQLYRYPHGGGYVEIKRCDVAVYSMFTMKGGIYIGGQICDLDEGFRQIQIEPGADVLGHNKPNLIIERWEWVKKGVGRKYVEYILELSQAIKLVKRIDGSGCYSVKSDTNQDVIKPTYTWHPDSASNTWQTTFKIADELGRTIPHVNIVSSYFSKPVLMKKPTYRERRLGYSDADGLLTLGLTETDTIAQAFRASKAGYYPTTIDNNVEWTNNREGNHVINLTLKKIGIPIAMYAKHINVKGPPVFDDIVGFDLVVGDWVAPYGRGKTTDIRFKRNLSKKSEMDYNDKLTVSFPSAGDGIQGFTIPADDLKCGLTSPREAPTSGYQDELVKVTREHPGQPLMFDYSPCQNYFFRVRTILDEQGQVKSALYGKIYGDFMNFCYYLNPTPNDRNIELAPSHNLISGQNIAAP